MVTEVETLVVRLLATQRDFERQMAGMARTAGRRANQVQNSFDVMNKNIARSSRLASNAIAQIAAPLAAGLSVRSITQYADAWTVAGNKIAAASEVAGVQARGLSELNDIADETRSGISETVDLYAKLLRATKGVAKSEQEVATATEIVNKAFKAGGAAASEQAAGILQLAQGLSSGVLQGDELRSLRENAPLIAQAIADEFNTTIGGLKELGAQGELTSARVFQAILASQSGIEAAFATTNATISDSFVRLRNAITEYVGSSGTAQAASDRIASSLKALADNLELATTAGVALGARFIAPVLVGQLSRAIPVIYGAAAALSGLGAGATIAASGLGLVRGVIALLGGPVGAVAVGLIALSEAMQRLPSAQQELEASIDNVTLAMGDEIAQINNLLALQPGANRLSLDAATAKLQEADAIYVKLEAQRQEADALIRSSAAYQSVLQSIDNYSERLNALASPGADLEQVPANLRSAYQEAEAGLLAALVAQRELLNLGGATNEELDEAAAKVADWREAIEKSKNGFVDLNGEIITGVDLTDRLAVATGGISAGLSGAAAEAARLADNLGIALSTALELANSTPDQVDEDAAFAVPVIPNGRQREQNRSAVANLNRITAPRVSSRGGASEAQKAAADAAKELKAFNESIDRQVLSLERQLEFLGKSASEVAELKTQYDLLDEAKRRGITVTDELTAKINAEAAEVGRLTQQYEDATDKISSLESIQSQFKDSVIDAALGGADAFDSFKDAIKRAAIEYALFGKGGEGGILGGVLGSVLDGIPGFATGGYTGSGSPSDPAGIVHKGEYVFDAATTKRIGVNNLEALSNGQILNSVSQPRAIGGRASGGAAPATPVINVNVNLTGANGNAEVRRIAMESAMEGVTQGMDQVRQEVPGLMAKFNQEVG